MNNPKAFALERKMAIEEMSRDEDVFQLSQDWIDATIPHNFVYNWRYLGLPIIQFPNDIIAVQEIVWKVKPTKIVETGLARGGSAIQLASLLATLDLCEYGKADLQTSSRRFIGIDIDIRSHNRQALEQHPMWPMIELIEGSSIDENIVDQVKKHIREDDIVMVLLDSNHTHDHVKSELELYTPLVSKGSYIVVQDTRIELAKEGTFNNRSWGKGNNPHTAVTEFLSKNSDFEIDHEINDKLLITSNPDGFLRRI